MGLRKYPKRDSTDRDMETAVQAAEGELPKAELEADKYGQYLIPFGEAAAREKLDQLRQTRIIRASGGNALRATALARARSGG